MRGPNDEERSGPPEPRAVSRRVPEVNTADECSESGTYFLHASTLRRMRAAWLALETLLVFTQTQGLEAN